MIKMPTVLEYMFESDPMPDKSDRQALWAWFVRNGEYAMHVLGMPPEILGAEFGEKST